MDAYFIKALGVLRPADAEAEEMLEQIPHGARVKVKVTRARSIPHHRLFFGLLKKVYEQSAASERFPSFDTFRDVVTIGAGYFDWASVGEKRFPVAQSIAFSKMGQDEFNKFFDAAVDCIANKLKLVEDADLKREWETMLEGEAA